MRARTRYRNRTRYGGGTSSSGSGSGSAALTLVGHDTFTGTNGADLEDRNPEEGVWVSSTSSFEIQSNLCAPVSGAAGVSLMEGPTTNGVIEVDVPTIPGVLGHSIVIHYIDANNYINLLNGTVWAADERTGGSSAQQVSLGAIANGDHLTIRLSDATVAFYVNGEHRGTMTGIAAGKVSEASHGFRNTGTGTTGRFDNWEMYVPSPFDPGGAPAGTEIDTFLVDTDRDARIIRPPAWDEGPVVVFAHGFDGDYLSSTEGDAERLTNALLQSGYAVASLSGGNSWGNQTAIDRYNELCTYLDSEYSVSSKVMWAQSMCGMNAVIDGTHTFTHVIAIATVCDLAAVYAVQGGFFASSIDTAYGINGTPYATATDGYDPILQPASAWTGIKVRFYAAVGDTICPPADHATAMSAHIASETASETVVNCLGGHFNATLTQPDNVLAFLAT